MLLGSTFQRFLLCRLKCFTSLLRKPFETDHQGIALFAVMATANVYDLAATQERFADVTLIARRVHSHDLTWVRECFL